MKLAEILNLIAIIIIPIIAVIIGQWLQTRSEKRKDKMHIFKTLMTSRVYSETSFALKLIAKNAQLQKIQRTFRCSCHFLRRTLKMRLFFGIELLFMQILKRCFG